MEDQPKEVDDELLLCLLLLLPTVVGRARADGIHVVVAVPLLPDPPLDLVPLPPDRLLPPLRPLLPPFATVGVRSMHTMIESTITTFITLFIFFSQLPHLFIIYVDNVKDMKRLKKNFSIVNTIKILVV